MSSTHGIIKLRRGTAAEWAASLPQPGGEVLRLGEPGYEKDTRKLKIGNGVDGWNNLDYINAGAVINPEDIEDIIGSGFLVAGTGINISYDDGSDSLTISTSGVSFSGHTHLSTDITDSTSFGRNILTADSYATQNKLSWQIVTFSIQAEPGGQYIIPTNFFGSATLGISDPISPSHGDWYVVIKPSGAGGFMGDTIIGDTTYSKSTELYLYRVYSNDSGPIPTTASWKTYTLDKLHNHIASDITNFNSAVSGLLPVKDIVAGTGIGVTSASGIYTITSTGSGIVTDQSKSLVTTVFNHTGSPIPKMSAVYINGGQGDRPTVALAVATGDPTSAGTYGLTYENIPNMEEGKVIVFGALTGLDTDQFNPTAPTGDVNGTVLYLSPTTPGALTKTKPSAPDHMVVIGTIVRTHQNEGVIEVRIQNGYELEELHNVAISGALDNQVLVYQTGVNNLWQNTTLSSSYISDFNSAVSGLLPTISNYGDNRILTSDGTSNGIVAENGMIFNSSTKMIDVVYDTSLGDTTGTPGLRISAYDNSAFNTMGGRVNFRRYGGTESSPSGILSNDTIGSIIYASPNSSGVAAVVARILVSADGSTGGSNIYTPSRISFVTSSGPSQQDNALFLYSDGKLAHDGYMTIDDGLSSPTPILSLGTVSGNTAISYDVDRQIQKLTLNGTAVNFTEGTGWDITNRSMDVMLEITVSSTTTVSFDAGFVTDWYNPLPTFSSGKYLVLLRSMGTGVVQGHYIGAKTN